MRVLLVEDNQYVGPAIVRSLGRRGMRVDLVISGAGALAATETYDVGIFDIDLPDGDGVDVARELLSKGVVGGAVFYSGTIVPHAQTRARLVGAFVEKGEDIAALILAVEQAATRAGRAARVANGQDVRTSPFPDEPPSTIRRRT